MYYNLVNSHTLSGMKLDLFHDYSLVVLVIISLVVFYTLLTLWGQSWVFDNFMESKLTELLWTSFPGIILLFLVIPSIYGLYNLDYIRLSNVKLNVVVSGRQWYWSYKFIPRSTPKELCLKCIDYFAHAEQQKLWFRTSQTVPNVLIPGWGKKIYYTSQDRWIYYISRVGFPTSLMFPKPLFDYLDPRLNKGHWSNEERYKEWLNDAYAKNLEATITFTPKNKKINYLPLNGDIYKSYHKMVFFENPFLTEKRKHFFEVDSYLVSSSQKKLNSKIGYFRNLDSSIPLILPSRKLIRFFFWSSDVIHSFALPDLSLKLDCVPGRLNSTFSFIRHIGKYYGQCSEMCGVYHSFMPISLEVHPYRWKKKKVCYGKHYTRDMDKFWNTFIYSFSLIRVWIGFCLWAGNHILAYMDSEWIFSYIFEWIGWSEFVHLKWSDVVASDLFPGITWLRKTISRWWNGS